MRTPGLARRLAGGGVGERLDRRRQHDVGRGHRRGDHVAAARRRASRARRSPPASRRPRRPAPRSASARRSLRSPGLQTTSTSSPGETPMHSRTTVRTALSSSVVIPCPPVQIGTHPRHPSSRQRPMRTFSPASAGRAPPYGEIPFQHSVPVPSLIVVVPVAQRPDLEPDQPQQQRAEGEEGREPARPDGRSPASPPRTHRPAAGARPTPAASPPNPILECDPSQRPCHQGSQAPAATKTPCPIATMPRPSPE